MSTKPLKERVGDNVSWAALAIDQLIYYVWSLTLCRIGHKPRMTQKTKTNGDKTRVVSAELSCDRCDKTLGFQISILLKEGSVDLPENQPAG